MIRYRVRRYPELASTNSFLYDLAAQGEAEGLVIAAEHQTAGRGKPGRRWISTPGKDLLFSVLLRPPVPPSKAAFLTQAVCRAVSDAVASVSKLSLAFKRPNDLMISGKKVCGVLVESSSRATPQVIDFAIAGVGLNVNADAGEVPEEGTSLQIETGKTWDREGLMMLILDNINHYMETSYDHTP